RRSNVDPHRVRRALVGRAAPRSITVPRLVFVTPALFEGDVVTRRRGVVDGILAGATDQECGTVRQLAGPGNTPPDVVHDHVVAGRLPHVRAAAAGSALHVDGGSEVDDGIQVVVVRAVVRDRGIARGEHVHAGAAVVVGDVECDQRLVRVFGRVVPLECVDDDSVSVVRAPRVVVVHDVPLDEDM